MSIDDDDKQKEMIKHKKLWDTIPRGATVSVPYLMHKFKLTNEEAKKMFDKSYW